MPQYRNDLYKVIPNENTDLSSHCKRNESWGVNVMEHKNKSCIIYKLVLTIESKVYHWIIQWNMMNTWCKIVLLVTCEYRQSHPGVLLSCSYVSMKNI